MLFPRSAALSIYPLTAAPVLQAAVRDVPEFGAKSGLLTIKTRAIQVAIDPCTTRDSGPVLLHGYRLPIAPIELDSNITLSVAGGPLLPSLSNSADYPDKIELQKPFEQALLSAAYTHDFAMVGEGIIDAAGECRHFGNNRFDFE